MSATWRVVKPEFVGNPEKGFHREYYSGDDFRTKPAAIRGGWEMYGHDDWLLLRLYDGHADRLFWMDEERNDFEELAEVAEALGLELTHVAQVLADAEAKPQMTIYYAAVKWPVDASRAEIERYLQNDLELMILTLIEEKGFDFDTVRRYFEDACDSVDTDLQDEKADA